MVAAASQLMPRTPPAEATPSNSPLKKPLPPVSHLLSGQLLQVEATLRRVHGRHELSCEHITEMFQCAVESGSAELLDVLLRHGLHDDVSQELPVLELLRRIVCEGDATLTQTLLRHVDSSLLVEEAGQRPLLLVAVEQDNEELVRVLLRYRDGQVFDPSVQDEELQWAPLHSAVEWNSIGVVTLLLQAGAQVDSQSSEGWTPLHRAAHHGHLESAELLIRAGASVDHCDDSGAKPLHIAARDGHTQLIDLLLDNGADLEARDADGLTPLHVAAFFDESSARFALGESGTQVAVVKQLLARGADAAARDTHGFTVLQAAEHGRFDVIVELLAVHHRGRL